jgi:Ca2+-binding EF-hand superfamily protein
MGASSSVDLRPEEIEDLTAATAYEPKEVKTLYKRFRRLDRSRRGTISADDLLMIPEVGMNPMSPRLVQLFARDGEGRVNFRAFAMGLCVFSERARADVKAASLHKVFDFDGDGFISEADLRATLAMMCGSAPAAASVDAIVAKTLAQCDADGDGRISLLDFCVSMRFFKWDSFTVPVKKTSREQYFAMLDERTASQGGGGGGGGGGSGPGSAGGGPGQGGLAMGMGGGSSRTASFASLQSAAQMQMPMQSPSQQQPQQRAGSGSSSGALAAATPGAAAVAAAVALATPAAALDDGGAAAARAAIAAAAVAAAQKQAQEAAAVLARAQGGAAIKT